MTDFKGLSVQFLLRSGGDNSVIGAAPVGWWIDDIRVYYGSSCTPSLADLTVKNGFDSAIP